MRGGRDGGNGVRVDIGVRLRTAHALARPATGVERRIRAKYLAGCDGTSSVTRRGLAIELDEMAPRDAMSASGKVRKVGSDLYK